MTSFIVDSGFGQKHFTFDNYIEFGKFLSELLYNFLYNFNDSKYRFSNKALYTLKNEQDKHIVETRVDILPNSGQKTILFINISFTEVNPKTLLLKDLSFKGQIYHISRSGIKDTHAYIINLDFSKLIYDDINVFRINKQFIDSDSLTGFAIRTAKTMFIL